MEIPSIETVFWQKYREKGLVVIGINLQESSDIVTSFVDQKKTTYPILLDTKGDVFQQYGSGYIPHNIVLDTGLIVRYSKYSYNKTEILTIIEKYIQ